MGNPDQIFILMTGDYADPSTILSAHLTHESGRAAFTQRGVKILLEDRRATLLETRDGELRIDSGRDFLSLTPFTVNTEQRGEPVTVLYRDEQHEVLWLGAGRGGAEVEIRPVGGSGGTHTVRVSDLDDAA